MLIEARKEGIPTCRSKSSKGEAIERRYDYVMAGRSLQGKIKNIEVVEDFEPRPHKAGYIPGGRRERDSGSAWVKKCQRLCQGTSGGKRARQKVETQRRRRKMKCDGWMMNAVWPANPIDT